MTTRHLRAAAAIAATVVAHTAHAEPPLGADRTLRGHTFVRPVADEGAFLPTSLGVRQGPVVRPRRRDPSSS